MKLSFTIAALALGAANRVGAAPTPKAEAEAAADAKYVKHVGKRQFYPVYGVSGEGSNKRNARVHPVIEFEKTKRQFYPVYGASEDNEKREAQFYPVYGAYEENEKREAQFYPVYGASEEGAEKREAQFYPVYRASATDE